MRTVLHFAPSVAPVKAAIFPLMKKEQLVEPAKRLYEELREFYAVEYDESGQIGKRYRRQDEIGTPYCFTIDFETIENSTITLRHRDSMKQERIPMDRALEILRSGISGGV